jgi:hypothetical protein
MKVGLERQREGKRDVMFEPILRNWAGESRLIVTIRASLLSLPKRVSGIASRARKMLPDSIVALGYTQNSYRTYLTPSGSTFSAEFEKYRSGVRT